MKKKKKIRLANKMIVNKQLEIYHWYKEIQIWGEEYFSLQILRFIFHYIVSLKKLSKLFSLLKTETNLKNHNIKSTNNN